MVRKSGLAVALLAATTISIGAAAPAPSLPGGLDLVAPLVVQAATPGPPWWKVTKGDSVLWILGTPPAISAPVTYTGTRPLKWDQTALLRRLAGAKGFLAPVTLPIVVTDNISPIRIVRGNCDPNSVQGAPGQEIFCVYQGAKLCRAWPKPEIGENSEGDCVIQKQSPLAVKDEPKNQVAVESTPPRYRVSDLDEVDRAELAAANRRFRLDPPHSTDTVISAYSMLNRMLLKDAWLDTTALTDQLVKAARSAGVPPKALNIKDQLDLAIKAYVSGPTTPQRTCLASAIARVRGGSGRDGPTEYTAIIDRSLKAWTRGDLPNALSAVGCVEERVMAYQVVAKATTLELERMMANDDKSVAGVELIPLLMKGGVIQALQAGGYTVAGPDLDKGGG